jgi:hypothetical protein
VLPAVPDGALYARVCSAAAGASCGLNGAATVSRHAAVRELVVLSVARQPADASCDFDGDGVGCAADNCWTDANPDQANADGDDWGDICDTWPGDP